MKSEITDFNDIFKSDGDDLNEQTIQVEVMDEDGESTGIVEVSLSEVAKSYMALKKGKSRKAKGAIQLGNEENTPTKGPGKVLGFMKLDRKGKKGKDLPPQTFQNKKNTKKSNEDDDIKKCTAAMHSDLKKGEKCDECGYMKKSLAKSIGMPVHIWVQDNGPTGDAAIAKAILAADGLGQGNIESSRNIEMEQAEGE